MISNKCESCGGELQFDFDSQELKCVQCSRVVDIPDVKIENKKNVFNESNTIKQKKVENTTYKCENCGRTCVFQSDTKSLKCAYCNSPNLIRHSKIEYVPDGIIPFKLNKKRAQTCFLDWLSKKHFLPKNLKKFISDSDFSAIYLPIYSYDFKCSSTYSGLGVNYNRDSNGEKTVSATHFSGTKKSNFTNFLESASSSILSKDLNSFGNFNLSNYFVYRTEYLYGIASLEPNINLQASCKEAKIKIKNIIQYNIKSEYRYDEIKNFVCNTTFNEIYYSHLYVPLWIHKFNFNNKLYSFFINGSTGKVCGKVPRSVFKILSAVFGFILGAGIIGLIVYLLSI